MTEEFEKGGHEHQGKELADGWARISNLYPEVQSPSCGCGVFMTEPLPIGWHPATDLPLLKENGIKTISEEES